LHSQALAQLPEAAQEQSGQLGHNGQAPSAQHDPALAAFVAAQQEPSRQHSQPGQSAHLPLTQQGQLGQSGHSGQQPPLCVHVWQHRAEADSPPVEEQA